MEASLPHPQNAFSGIGRDVVAKLMQTEPPASLYHYTTPSGLEGILRSSSLWLTDTRFMNDTSEGVYGLNLAVHLIREFLSEKEDAIALGERVIAALQKVVFANFTAACCFCREPDLLTQWRAYGGNSVSYCIEFETAGFSSPSRFRPALLEVVYRYEDQVEFIMKAVRAVYEQAMALAEDSPEMPDEQVDVHIDQAAAEIGQVLYWLKHPAFSSEREHRLALEMNVLKSLGVDHSVRPSPFGFTPYFPWHPDSEMLPIKSIMVGPAGNRDYAQVGLKALVATTKYKDVTIADPSRIPVR
jgi:hypothetical protein